MSKQTMTKSQLREAINGLGPLAPDWLVEALEDFIELQEAHKNLLAMHAEDAYHLDEARAKHDEPVGVARTNAILKQGDTFCVFELGSVPEGTKLYTRPPKQEQSPKVAPTVAIDERAEFEKWANKHKGGEPLQLGGGGTYTNPFANAAYEAWQAARKLPAPEVAPATVTIVPDAELFQAIARGWCHDANKQKEMDVDLALAIAEEVKAMLKGAK